MEREPGFTYPVITEPYAPQSFKPRQYVIYRTIDDIFIDGKLDESTWEIAARGSEERPYPWGNAKPDVTRANFDYHIGHTVPVGSYPEGKTPEGVYDMAGNVNEMIDQIWVEYPWGKKRDDNQKPSVLPLCRGGAWTSPVNFLKATYRDVVKHHFMEPFVGFRCAKDVE